MYKLILMLAGLGLVAIFATASLAEPPGARGEQDVLTAEAAQQAPSEMESSEGQAAAEKGVKSATTEKRKAMKKERKRGLDRADEVAGERGKKGRDKAREKQQR